MDYIAYISNSSLCLVVGLALMFVLGVLLLALGLARVSHNSEDDTSWRA